MASTRILVVEDDEMISRSIFQTLHTEQCEVQIARSGEEAMRALESHDFNLMVLDIGLPGCDGLDVLAALRRQDQFLPVLILSARAEVDERVTGLKAGADDYLTKPFAITELEARVQALLRRGPATAKRLTVNDLILDTTARTVFRAGKRIELTALEFELLEFLMRHARQVVSRETLAREVWKLVNRATSLDNVMDVHIGRLRKKLEYEGMPSIIHTMRGVGFVISEHCASSEQRIP